MLEFYRFFGDLLMLSGITVAVVYAIISLIYITYRFTKGDDLPGFDDIPKVTESWLNIRYYINPFYFKHPAHYVMAGLNIFSIPFIIGVAWPVLIPASVIYYFAVTTRKKNIEKKKMWETLKD